jgi:hypothetical protein
VRGVVANRVTRLDPWIQAFIDAERMFAARAPGDSARGERRALPRQAISRDRKLHARALT